MWVCCFVEFCFYYTNYCWYSEISDGWGWVGVGSIVHVKLTDVKNHILSPQRDFASAML